MVKLNDETSHEEGPVTPASFGEQFRRTREGAGLRIEDIVAETKVSKTIFEALEDGRFQRLPELVFSRSFVAQYARTVGVDEGPVLSLFDQAWAEYTSSSGIHPELDMGRDDLGPSIRWRFWIPIVAGIMILLGAAAVILRGSSSPGEGLAPDPRRSGARQASETTLATHPTVIPTPRMNPAEIAPEAADDAMVKMMFEVGVGEECWIHYRDRDGMTGEKLLANADQLTLELAGPVKLTIGNAGAVRLTIDGHVYADLGLLGQVIHTEVTRDRLTPLGSTEHERP